MDRAIASGAIGREFESLRAHQISSLPTRWNHGQGSRVLAVPAIVSTPARRGRKDGILGWVCVAAGDCNRAVPSDMCKRPSVTPGLAQPLTTTGQPQIVSRWGCECDNEVTPTLLRDAIKFPTHRFSEGG